MVFSQGQLFSQNHWEAGLTLGYTNYLGDLVEPTFTFKDPHPAAQGFIRKSFDAHHAYRLSFMYGKISGSDANFDRNAARGASFENTIFEIASIGEIDLFGKKRYPRKGQFKKSITPYLLLGIGFTFGEPEVNYGNIENVDDTEDYPNWHISIPVGLGVKMDVNENIFVGLEFINRATLSDNLDGVQLSGNAYRNDAIIFGGLTVGFRILPNPGGVPMTIQGEPSPQPEVVEKEEKKKKEKKEKTKKVKKDKESKQKKERKKKKDK